MDLIDHLQGLAARAEQTGDSLTNEEATKMALIAPFIQALGYDIFKEPLDNPPTRLISMQWCQALEADLWS